jgi:hypothetical protein
MHNPRARNASPNGERSIFLQPCFIQVAAKPLFDDYWSGYYGIIFATPSMPKGGRTQ